MSTEFERLALPLEKVRALVWLWDPIGVAGDRNEVPDEYDDLAFTVVRLIARDMDRAAFRAELVRTMHDHYGLGDFGIDDFMDALQASP